MTHCSLTCTSIDLQKINFLHNAYNHFTELVEEFDILDENKSTQGLRYDYLSAMHPDMYKFGKGRMKTIVPLNFIGCFSHVAYPSDLDILHMNILYCEGNTYNYTLLHTCILHSTHIYVWN